MRLVVSFVVWATMQGFDGAFCRGCGLAVFRRLQLRTLMLGWWSLVGLPMTVVALAGNVRARGALARLPAPAPTTAGPGIPMAPLPAGPPLWRRPSLLVPVGVVLALGLSSAALVAARAERDEEGTVVEAGDVSVMTLAEGDCEHCLALFRTYVGREYAYSELDVTWLEPTRSGWALGDRDFTCLAVPLDGSKLTGVVRGSGR